MPEKRVLTLPLNLFFMNLSIFLLVIYEQTTFNFPPCDYLRIATLSYSAIKTMMRQYFVPEK